MEISCKYRTQRCIYGWLLLVSGIASGMWMHLLTPRPKCIFLSKRLRETRAGSQREPIGGINATSYRDICTAEYIGSVNVLMH